VARTAAVLILLAALGALLWLGRWQVNERRAGGDAFWYARSAYQFAGRDDGEATRGAAEVMARYRGQSGDGWLAAPSSVDPRYQAIFRGRPLYPAVSAPFVTPVGPDAMVVGSLLGGAALAAGVGLGAARLAGSWPVGAVAAALVFVLPSGAFVAYLGPEGWMLAVWTLGLAVAVAHAARPGPWLLGMLALVTVVLAATKSSNAGVLALTLLLVALVAIARRSPERRALVRAAAVGGAVLTGSLAVAAVLGLPGLSESVQDLLTDHFTKPDVESPWLELALFDLRQLPRWLVGLTRAPVELALGLVGAIALLRLGWERAAPWLIGAAATVLVVLLHPVTSEIPRLLAPIWVSVAVGLAVGAAEVAAWMVARVRVARPPE